MTLRQTLLEPAPAQECDLPAIWLLSDARNDSGLEAALAKLPRRSGFIFRHYHLDPKLRRERFRTLSAIARKHGHLVVLSDEAALARRWGAEGIYGAPGRIRRAGGSSVGFLHLATAHNLPEIVASQRAGADAVLISPIFATRSHEDAKTLGPVRFGLLARKARIPVIALGGMDAGKAKRLGWPRWAAIDGLS